MDEVQTFLRLICVICGKECNAPTPKQIADSEHEFGSLNENEPIFACEGSCLEEAIRIERIRRVQNEEAD